MSINPNSTTIKKPTAMKLFVLNVSASQADLWFSIFNAVLIIGAALVLVGTIGAIIMASVREEFSNERISTNEAETQRAITRGEEAKKDAAEANARAANANQKAEEERLARVRIELRLADRKLNESQLSLIAEKLKRFGGQEFLLHVPMGDPREPHTLALRIHSSLILSGWKFVQSNAMVMPGREGIVVTILPDARNSTVLAATMLVEILNAEDIKATLSRGQSSLITNVQLEIGIGNKP